MQSIRFILAVTTRGHNSLHCCLSTREEFSVSPRTHIFSHFFYHLFQTFTSIFGLLPHCFSIGIKRNASYYMIKLEAQSCTIICLHSHWANWEGILSFTLSNITSSRIESLILPRKSKWLAPLYYLYYQSLFLMCYFHQILLFFCQSVFSRKK